jgi:hypothetical protein
MLSPQGRTTTEMNKVEYPRKRRVHHRKKFDEQFKAKASIGTLFAAA